MVVTSTPAVTVVVGEWHTQDVLGPLRDGPVTPSRTWGVNPLSPSDDGDCRVSSEGKRQAPRLVRDSSELRRSEDLEWTFPNHRGREVVKSPKPYRNHPPYRTHTLKTCVHTHTIHTCTHVHCTRSTLWLLFVSSTRYRRWDTEGTVVKNGCGWQRIRRLHKSVFWRVSVRDTLSLSSARWTTCPHLSPLWVRTTPSETGGRIQGVVRPELGEKVNLPLLSSHPSQDESRYRWQRYESVRTLLGVCGRGGPGSRRAPG